MAISTWNPTLFLARYPEFASANVTQLGAIFAGDAGLYLDNTDCSPVQTITKRTMLLNMLTAHIAALGGALSSSQQAPPVGQVLSAAEGSVNAAFANVAPQGGTAAWYAQTQYGLDFWNATLNLRGMRYVRAPQSICTAIGARWRR
jgi:hypothetical protein